MKFWQKAFFATLIVSIVSINGCLYMTSRYSFSLNLEQETSRVLGEYHIIAAGIEQTMVGLESRRSAVPTAAAISGAMSALADYYAKQDVYLSLRQSRAVLFSDVPSAATAGLRSVTVPAGKDTLAIRRLGGSHYLYIVGLVQGLHGDDTLTYVTNLAALYQNQTRLADYLVLISIVTETLLALVLVATLRRLTRPIRLLQRATRKIVGGVYADRVRVGGRDEFHDLAENFNRMAAAIQEKIAALDSAVHEKQRMMDNLAHELKTPLTAMMGHAQYLQGAHAQEEGRIKAAGHILSATNRMRDLVYKVLDLALLRTGEMERTEIRPEDLLFAVAELTAATLQAKDITLDVRCLLETPLIGDATLLQSLLTNLIDNAAKASSDHGTITLSSYFDGSPTIEVRDSGCGMAADQVSLVWEPFYRIDSARSRSAGGVGLGLPLCREIARLHQARLEIDSQVQKGTTVRLVFATPLQADENSVTSAL